MCKSQLPKAEANRQKRLLGAGKAALAFPRAARTQIDAALRLPSALLLLFVPLMGCQGAKVKSFEFLTEQKTFQVQNYTLTQLDHFAAIITNFHGGRL